MCVKHEDDQESLLVRGKLVDSNSIVENRPQYGDLFSTDVHKQLTILISLKKKIQLRKKLLRELEK